jgi:hypothetical protein
MDKRIIKPGKWLIVQLRQMKTHDQVAAVLVCRNAYRAGHNGWSRKYTMVNAGTYPYRKVRKYKRRSWDLRPPKGCFPYKFADLKDARASARIDLIKNWTSLNEGFVEIVEVEGCLQRGECAPTTRKVVQRLYPKGTNEMLILAMEGTTQNGDEG